MRIGFGIDFGTTNSVLSHVSGAQPVPILDDENRPHPSVVWFEGDKVTVGREAKRRMHRHGDQGGHCFVKSIKRKLGISEFEDVLGARMETYKVASRIFSYLKDSAHGRAGLKRDDMRDCVVTVPIYFDGRRRSAIRKAAEHAGWHVKAMVHEPFAAVVAYLHRRNELNVAGLQRRTLLVFDWGGGTLDITLVRVDSDGIRELGVGGIKDRAGDDFDQIVMGHATEQFLSLHGLAANALSIRGSARDRFGEEAELRKIELSSQEQVTIQVERFSAIDGQDRDLTAQLSRTAFERRIEPDVVAAMNEVAGVMERSRISNAEVDDVLMIGGTSKVPRVLDSMRERFGPTKVLVPDDADSIIASGAALIAYHEWSPFLTRGVYVRTADNACHPIFPPNTAVAPSLQPSRPTYFCTDPRDGTARVVVCEGMEEAGTKATVMRIVAVPVKSKVSDVIERVYTEFRFDQDLVLNVEARGSLELKTVRESIVDFCYGLKVTS